MKKVMYACNTLLFFILIYSFPGYSQNFNGHITLSNQAQIDSFPYKNVIGRVVIEESSPGAIQNLDSLKILESSYGLYIQNNSAITNINGLKNLRLLTGDFLDNGYGLRILNNALLENVDGLSALRAIGYPRPFSMANGYITIEGNPMLKNLNGMYNLDICSSLIIRDNISLDSFCGLFNLMALHKVKTYESTFMGGVTDGIITISGNAQNPTYLEIAAGGPCNPARNFIVSLSPKTDSTSTGSQGSGGAFLKFNKSMDSLYIWARLCNLQCPLSKVYIQSGSGPYLDITSYFHPDSNGFAADSFRVETYPFDPIQAYGNKFIKGEMSINVITEGHSKGEISGYAGYDKPVHLYASLDGDQETPPVSTSGSGEGYFVLSGDGDSLYYHVNAYNLSGPVSASHFHKAPFGVPGPVVKPISFMGDSLSEGYWTNMDTQPLTPALVADLLGCQLYVNVHTPNHPMGEIRGQIYQRMDNNVPYMTVWGTRNDQSQDNFSRLTYYSLAEGANFENNEGDITGYNGKKNIESFTIDPGGNFFFLNNTWASMIYRISPDQLDLNASTPVKAIQMGRVKTPDDKLVNISSIHFIKGKLYALDNKTNTLYSVNQFNALVNQVAQLDNLSASSAGFTSAADGNVYIIKNTQQGSELWKFDKFPSGQLSFVTSVKSFDKLNSLTAHPNGNLYASDSKNLYEINLNKKQVGVLQNHQVDLTGMDFDFAAERAAAPASTLQFQDVSGITDISEFTKLPAQYSLAQNYPNPFNPSTIIRYELPEAAFVKLNIYNALGELVKTLVNQNMDAGVHQFTFDAAGLPSGMYIYKIEAGPFSKSNKMILLK